MWPLAHYIEISHLDKINMKQFPLVYYKT